MPRTSRQHSTSGMYHVIFRGVNQQDIFDDDEDRQMFLWMLHEVTETVPVSPLDHPEPCLRVYNYCLMTNHVHLLVGEILTQADYVKMEQPQGSNLKIGISEQMLRLGRKYSMWFNNKYGRSGHLFQDRFKSEPVEDERYMMTVFRYIARNPYKAGMVADPNDYLWSGWWEYLHPTAECWLSKKGICQKWTMSDLIELVHAEPEGEVMDIDERKRLSDREVKDLMMELCGQDTATGFMRLDKPVRETIIRELLTEGAGQMQLVRMTGMTREVIRRIVRNK